MTSNKLRLCNMIGDAEFGDSSMVINFQTQVRINPPSPLQTINEAQIN